jgi:hypothetical protein
MAERLVLAETESRGDVAKKRRLRYSCLVVPKKYHRFLVVNTGFASPVTEIGNLMVYTIVGMRCSNLKRPCGAGLGILVDV